MVNPFYHIRNPYTMVDIQNNTVYFILFFKILFWDCKKEELMLSCVMKNDKSSVG